MLRAVDHYLLRQLAGRVALALCALCGLYLAIDLADNGQRLAQLIGWRQVILSTLHRLPTIAVQVAPAATYCSIALYSLRLAAQGERAALDAIGYTPWRWAAVVFCIGGALTALAFLTGELIVPRLEQRADAIGAQTLPSLFGRELNRPSQVSWRRDNRWLVGRQGRRQVRILLDERGLPQKRLQTALADQPTAGRRPRNARTQRPEVMPLAELATAISERRRNGQPTAALATIYQLRRVYPLYCLAAALLAMLLSAGGSGQRQSLARAAIGLLGIFAVIAAGFMAGQAGWVSPALASWGPWVALCVIGAALALLNHRPTVAVLRRSAFD
ncbi:MAG: LptF/LptG family permease [Deltaproteobacteria bacterium]|nr:LptF/LptG family permease [Deltaproteobacteria bacterium]